VGSDPAQILAGQVAIVTGAAQGIGRATAFLLSSHGAHVVVADLNMELAETCARELPAAGIAVGGDITSATMPGRLVDAAVSRWGRLDIIVNNAGYPFDAMVHKMTDDQFLRMLEVHVTAPFRLIRAAAPYLMRPPEKSAAGRPAYRKVVNIASIAGQLGAAGTANYSAGKAAVVGLTRSLAKEWGQFGVNCNAACFGPIDTRLSAVSALENTTSIGGEVIRLGVPAQQRAAIKHTVPLGRHGSAEEAAGGVFFLCSPWSDYVHGQVLNVTGGFTGGMSL
jgi:3-oxoacyl-[acyl-carrier protein] reductase